MALSAKLTMRQGQAMVLTPQLLQAIKLLQMPNVELSAFIESELASNPLLERAEEHEAAAGPEPSEGEPGGPGRSRRSSPATGRRKRSKPTAPRSPPISARKSKTHSIPITPRRPARRRRQTACRRLRGRDRGRASESGEAPDLEAFVAETLSLHEHLERQAGVLLVDPAERMIGAALIDGLDETGYFVGSLDAIAERLGATVEAVEKVLLLMQTLEPTGIFARTLAECLTLQLRERDRFDPAMQALIENLPALWRGEIFRCCAGSAESTTKISST